MYQRLVSGGFILNKGKFLIVKRSDNDNFMPSIWEIPGGKLEYEEEPNAGALREILEETGLKVRLISPVGTWTYENPSRETQYIQVDYLCEIEPQNQEVTISEEHSAFAWITFDEMNEYDISPEMKKELEKIKNHPLVRGLTS